MKKSLNKRPWRIISGGQTGVDRAGLVAAMSFSIRVGGWLPKGRMAEDGVVPEGFYGMQECEGGYRERTRAGDVVGQIRDWMLSLEDSLEGSERIVLNVAGPRESISPGIFAKAKQALLEVFASFRNWSGGDLCAIGDDGDLIAWLDAEFVAELEDEESRG